MENELELSNYQQSKQRIKENIQIAAESFVVIGFELRQIRDKQLYKLDGYKTITEFAEKEYGLKQSATSRYIKINEKFSISGSSPSLLPQYDGFGETVLAEMLNLSDEAMDLVTVQTTRAEIREIKEVQKAAESENYAPAHNPQSLETTQSEANFDNPLECRFPDAQNLIPELFRDKYFRDVFKALAAVLQNNSGKGWNPSMEEKAMEILNPTGHRQLKYKLVIVLLGEKVKYSKFRVEQREFTYADLVNDLVLSYDMSLEDPWVAYYGEPEPELPPEPPKPITPPKPEPKKESKPATKPAPTQSKPVKAAEKIEEKPEENLPGQDHIDNHPEYQCDPSDKPTGGCLYRTECTCTLSEANKRIAGDGEHCNTKCCWKCTKQGDCKYECNSSLLRDNKDAVSESEKITDSVTEVQEPDQEELSEVVEAEIVESAPADESIIHSDEKMDIKYHPLSGELLIILKNGEANGIRVIKAVDQETGNIWSVEVNE